MLNIKKSLDGSKLTVCLEGRLDTVTAPELEASLNENINDVTNLVFDLEKLDYVSSAGLRVFLSSHKKMMKQGEMVVKNVNEAIAEILEVTGFNEILNIE